jgi:CheY-like chemotaxis protein
VLFPASSSSAPELVEENTEAAPCRGWGTVLVVDDEEVVRVLARETLKDAGFEVLVAEDGREAVEIYRARANEIDAIVLDLSMPRMDGVETFTEMRRIRNDAPVILSSGYNEQEATERFAGKGLTGFLHKPYCADSLVRLVHRVACESRARNSR